MAELGVTRWHEYSSSNSPRPSVCGTRCEHSCHWV